MGRQLKDRIFVGSFTRVNGYIDDEKGVCRHRSSLNKEKWLKYPSMGGQRIAAQYFSAASVIAGNLWSGLPIGMRRLADGGGFNRLVGICNLLIEDDGQLGEVDGLLNLDLSIDSMGPLRVDSRQFTVDSLGSEVGSRFQGLGASLGFEEGLEGRLGQVSTCAYKLVGVDALCDDLDVVSGVSRLKEGHHFVVGHRHVMDGVVRSMENWHPDDGSCTDWARAWKERAGGGHGKGSGVGYRSGHAMALPKRLERRVRVWVHASEVVPTVWNAKKKVFVREPSTRAFSGGYVTDWLPLKGFDIASAYSVESARIVFPDSGAFVVFTAVEVSEKRGRHWVRLPWACKMRVSDVVDNGWAVLDDDWLCSEMEVVGRAVLVAVPERVVEGAGRREWDFLAWELNFQQRQDFLVDGVLEGCLVEFKVSLGDDGHVATCPYENGGLIRAGP